MPSGLPVLYSFRRCPYAMRARLALLASGTECELREIVLRDKADELLAASPKATVPVLVAADGTVFEQSLDIMIWALNRDDPDQWLTPTVADPGAMMALIARADSEFKANLDRYKYHSRHSPDISGAARDAGLAFLGDLNTLLAKHKFLFGGRISLADMAIAPFVRQFAQVDRDWFDSLSISFVQNWLNWFLNSNEFNTVMTKYPKWQAGDPVTVFPERQDNAS